MILGFQLLIARRSALPLCVTFATLVGYCHAEDERFHFSATKSSAQAVGTADAGSIVAIPIGNDGETLVEVRLLVNQEPCETSEERALSLLFEHFDRNHDDVICGEESRYLPDLSQNTQLLWNPLGAPRMLNQGDNPSLSFASRRTMIDWYRQNGLRCLHVGFGIDQASGLLSRRINEVVEALRDSHSTNSTNVVARERFKHLDANADGFLVAHELVRDVIYPSTSASEPIALATNQVASTRWTIHVTRSLESSMQDCSTSFHRLGPLDEPAVLVRYDAGSVAEELKRSHGFLSNLFGELDVDHNDQLSTDELRAKTARLMRTYVPFADVDRDQMLTRSELEAWLRLWGQLAQSQWQLSIVDQSIGLWERLDEDHDGRLSVTEWCRGVDRHLASEAEPKREASPGRQLRVTVSPGRPRTLTATIDRSGSAWFGAADANADGVVQKDEFVGPLEIFAEMDANGDGMIDEPEWNENSVR